MTDTQEVSEIRQRYCQVPDCLRRPTRVVEIELPSVLEPTATYTILTFHADFCSEHGREVERRVGALVEARDDLHKLLVIVEAAILAERGFRTAGAAPGDPAGACTRQAVTA